MVHSEELEKIISLNKKISEVLKLVREQVNGLSVPFISEDVLKLKDRIKELKHENELLKQECDTHTDILTSLMIENGTDEIHLKPFVRSKLKGDKKDDKSEISKSLNNDNQIAGATDNVDAGIRETKPAVQTKERKATKRKKSIEKFPETATAKVNAGDAEKPVHIGRLDIRVGRILSVEKHPDADTLYVEKVDFSNGTIKTVVSGLVKYISIEELNNRTTIFLCNLKPVKMRGVLSEAMLLCANGTDKVELFEVPERAVPGDYIMCQAFDRNPDPVLNPKKKIFEAVAPDLKVNESGVATYKNIPLVVPWKGILKVPTLTNATIR